MSHTGIPSHVKTEAASLIVSRDSLKRAPKLGGGSVRDDLVCQALESPVSLLSDRMRQALVNCVGHVTLAYLTLNRWT